MNRPSFDQIVELLIRHERNISEVKQCLDALTRKVDFLIDQSITRNRPVAEVSNPVTLSNENALFEFNSFGIFNDPYDVSNFGALQPTPSDPDILPPQTAPASMVYRDGVWADPILEPPTVSRVQTNPMSSVNMSPGYDSWSHGGYPHGSGDDAGDGGFLGGGHGDHRFTERWTGVSAQQAEASTSLVPTKPSIIENDNQSEQSSIPHSSSRGKYDRTSNAKQKKQLFSSIWTALGLPWNRDVDETLTLRTAIERFGGTVPVVPEPANVARKTQRWKQDQRSTYFHKLKEVLELDGRFVELEVLDGVLKRLTNHPVEPQGSQAKYEGCGAFRV